jgi:hypothetical protein
MSGTTNLIEGKRKGRFDNEEKFLKECVGRESGTLRDA